MKKRLALTIAAAMTAVTVMFGTTACGTPCAGLTVSDRDRQAAADGYEVEKEDNLGNECELDEDGEWEVED